MTSLGLALQPDEAASHLTRLYRLAWSLCGSPHVAEDLVQETYLRVLARPRRVRNPDSFAYLARTLRNVTTDHRRSESTRERSRLPADDVDPPDHRVTGDPVLAALAGEVYGAVSDLPDHHRDVVAGSRPRRHELRRGGPNARHSGRLGDEQALPGARPAGRHAR